MYMNGSGRGHAYGRGHGRGKPIGIGGWADDLGSLFTSGAQLAVALRPPPSPVGTTPLSLPQQQGYVAPPPSQQRSMFSDPMTLAMIGLAGVTVLILLLKR
jgi:hypothetical protein